MLIDTFEKRIIITPPKVGSANLHQAFSGFPGIRLVHGPNPDGLIDHHFTGIHNDHLDYEVLVLVRHPYDRLRSLWNHFLDFDKVVPQDRKRFKVWFQNILTDGVGMNWMYKYTILRWLGTTKVNGHIKIEEISEFFAEKYPRIKMLPKEPRVPQEIPWENADQKLSFIKFYREDAERFGYVL